MAYGPYTEFQGHVSFSLTNGPALDNKSWDKFDPPEHAAETSQWTPGGMAPAQAIGGITKRGQATLERAWDDTMIGLYTILDANLNQPIAVQQTSLVTATTASTAKPGGSNWTGLLRSVKGPVFDSTSSTIQRIVCIVELNEAAT